MSDDPRSPRGSEPPSLNARLDIPEGERYRTTGLLGQGGMGAVHAVRELRLDREEALKVAIQPGPEVEARLLREASLTSRLEHPGIVPVLSAGRLPDGRAYYTMRVIRGESLQAALRRAPDLPARLALMRSYLDATEALAHAHSRGVIHRDLKPANVMLGEHGGTVVVDWGLATTLDATALPPLRPPEPPAEPTWLPGEDLPSNPTHGPATLTLPPARPAPPVGSSAWELTRPGEIFGTPAYMPPEQARGEPLDRRADVYALGGVLYAILTGRPPRLTEDPSEPVAALLDLAPDAPPELIAIAERAMDPIPARRYRDAGELAADVAAWFEGRRVWAYSYSSMDLVRRAIRAWRVPLIVSAVALIAVAAAVGVGWWRTVVERNRAVQAEKAAVLAQVGSDAYLARALLAQARVATDRGQRAQAELLSAHRLRLGESPEARGTLARFAGIARPTLLSAVALSDCSMGEIDRTGERVACLGTKEARIYAVARPEHPVAILPAAFSQARFCGPDEGLVVLRTLGNEVQVVDLDSGARTAVATVGPVVALYQETTSGSVVAHAGTRLVEIDPVARTERVLGACANSESLVGGHLGSAGQVLLVCATQSSGAQVRTLEPTGSWRPVLEIPSADGVVTGTWVGEGSDPPLLVGTERGLLYVRDAEAAARRLETGLEAIVNIEVYKDRVALRDVSGQVSVLDLEAGASAVRLPDGLGTPRWIADGARLRLFGASVEDWSIPAEGMRGEHALEAGVSAVAISSDARLLGWSLGSGRVTVVERESGRVVLDRVLDASVAKDLAFSADGRRLAVGAARGPGALVYGLPGGELLETVPSKGVRRVAWLGEDLLVAPYEAGLLRDHGGVVRTLASPGGPVGELDSFAEGDGVVLVEDPDVIYRLRLGDAAPTPLAGLAGVQAVAATGDSVYAVSSAEIRRIDRPDAAPVVVPLPRGICGGALEVGVAPAGRVVAVGCFDGMILVFAGDDLHLLATLRGHTSRVGSLAFDGSGRWLLSGGWDATARIWDLSVLDRGPEELIAPLEASWGMGLDEALGG